MLQSFQFPLFCGVVNENAALLHHFFHMPQA